MGGGTVGGEAPIVGTGEAQPAERTASKSISDIVFPLILFDLPTSSDLFVRLAAISYNVLNGSLAWAPFSGSLPYEAGAPGRADCTAGAHSILTRTSTPTRQEVLMPGQLVECIPNFSEGRRPELVAEIRSAIEGVGDVYVLDQHSDRDHNRSVITFVAPPGQVVDAAFAGIAAAARLIDLDHQEGEHPRIGAADVVPFVPISGVTAQDCVELARQLGRRVGDELGIPVYLYEDAATRPDRVNLEDIRRGEYEALKAAIESDPDRAPDFGPPHLGPAGATVIGARAPLIAYNVYLTTSEVEIAKKIARTIRHSSGGLRYVKSIGLLVDGMAQVSINLTDYTRTPIATVVELIRREAARYGVAVHHCELVGLAPQASLIEAARWYLQLDQFEPDQILETRLYEATQGASTSSPDFLEALASGTATPGGGSAAAHVGALGAALVGMVARLTTGKKKYADVEADMKAIAEQADSLRSRLVAAVAHDAQAFEAVMDALKLPKDSDDQKETRAVALEAAIHGAAEVPLEVCRLAVEVLGLAALVAELGNVNASSDAGAAASMARASLEAAGMNVRINANSASDEAAVRAWQDELTELNERAGEYNGRIQQAISERAKI